MPNLLQSLLKKVNTCYFADKIRVMAPFFRLLACAALILLCVVEGRSQAFDFKCLSQSNGLPAAGVYHLAEDSLGRLLIGTEGGGFARYDGNRFTVWDHTNGLNADTIRCLLPALDGTIWLGADGAGLWRFNDEQFHPVTHPLLHKVEVRSIAQTRDQTLWIGTLGAGLLTLRNDSVAPYPAVQADNIRALLSDHEGKLYIGTDRGLFVLVNGLLTALVNPAGEEETPPVLALFQDDDKRIWVGTDDGVLLVVGKTWQRPDVAHLRNERVRTIEQDQQGDLWFGTQNGVFEFEERNSSIHQYTTESGLSNNRIRNIYRDRSGTLWFSTYFGGICQLTTQSVVFFNREQGFPQSPINAVVIAGDTLVVMGTFDGSVFTWSEGGRPKRVYQSRALTQSNMVSALHLNQNELLIGTEYDGLLSIDLKTGRRTTAPNIPGRWVMGELIQLFDYKANAIAVGTQAIYHNGQTLTASDLRVERINNASLFNDVLYLGTNSGLLLVSPETLNVERVEETINHEVSALTIDNAGNVWFGTLRDGLYRLTGGMVRKQAGRYLPDNRINGLSLDPLQDLWVATRKGVTHLELDPAQELILGAQHYGAEHGLIGQVIGNAMVWDQNQHLWMGTSRGLFRLDPEGTFHNPNPPTLRLIGLRLVYESVDWTQFRHDRMLAGLPLGLVLEHHQNHLTFDFKAIDLSDPEQTVFQCKLDGYDPEWIDLGRRATKTYAFLPPGDYVFMIRSRNSSGLWNEAPLEFAFQVRPPFYTSAWFIALAALFVVFVVLTFVRLRVRRLRIRNEALMQLVDERTTEVREAQEKSERLLLNILPAATAEELKETGTARARRYTNVSVLFSDLKGFTAISEQVSPDELVKMLDDTFRLFDAACDTFGIEKIKTMGDAYMCACGLPKERDDHAQQLIAFAHEMLQCVETINANYQDRGMPQLHIRIGINSGPVIAGVVGDKKFAYDIWGDTVNVASRMESSGEVGRINISKTTFELIKDQIACEPRGLVPAKNKGDMEMYFVTNTRIPKP